MNGAGKIHVRQGIPVIKPGMVGASHENDSIRVGAADHLPPVEFDLVEGAFDQFAVEAVCRHIPQCIENQGLDLRGFVRFGSPEAHGEGDLFEVPLQTRDRREILPETGIDEGLPERCGGAADEEVGDDRQEHRRLGVGIFHRHPGQVDRCFSGEFFFPVDRIKTMNGPWFPPRILVEDGGIHSDAVKADEHLRQKSDMFFRRDVTVEEKAGVRRRIEDPVEFPELLVGQSGDHLRISPRVEGVRRLRVEIFLDGFIDQGVRRGVSAPHLVVDDAGYVHLPVVLEFEVAAFLEKGLFQEPRPEDQVGIDPGEVEEIALLLTGDGIDRLVGIGEGVDEGLERSLEEFIEDVLERIALGSCEDGMFEDMGHAGRVARRRPKTDGEEVFPVVAVEVEDFGPRFFVFDLVGRDPDLGDLFDPPYEKTMPPVPCGERRRRTVLFYDHLYSFPILVC